MPQVGITTLEGTYLVWLDIRPLGQTSDEITRRLLSEGKVLVNSGTMYGEQEGEGFIRVNIACPRSQLMTALESMSKVLA
jgi:cystathionine beta-lyase